MSATPRAAVIPKIGKVRVLGYHGQGRFIVVDGRDERRLVHRDRLRFIKSDK